MNIDKSKIKHRNSKYQVASCFIDKITLCGSGELVPLDIASEYRSVFLCEKTNAVIKCNTFKTLRRRVLAQFGMLKKYGRFSLFDEFNNLKKLSHLDFVPKFYAFGQSGRLVVKKEILIIKYYQNSLTADEALFNYPKNKVALIEKVFHLFLKAWESNCIHLDPKPENILFLENMELKFIDFENCYIGRSDKEFSLAFYMGYFFNYWPNKSLSNLEYSDIVKDFLNKNCSNLNIKYFNLYFCYFKNNEISRRKRDVFFSDVLQRKKLLV